MRISFESVTKVFDERTTAVDDVSLEIEDGEFMVLVGPSGCGKSTILRMLAGLEEVTSGSISIGGRDVTRLPAKDRELAMVFQDYALYPFMTVAQNIGFGLRLRKTPKAEIARAVAEAARILGLEDLLDRHPAQLSGGQRQRVAMGRAIVREPHAFLMDEPLSNLDAKLRVQMRAELARLHRRLGTTTVYVTHDQVEAMTLGDRVAVLRNGRIEQLDTPQALFRRPANVFVAAFVGSPAMNLVDAHLDAEAVTFGQFRVPLTPRPELAGHVGRRVILGIRPSVFDDAEIGRLRGLPTIDLAVDVVEDLGDESLVVFTVDAPRLPLETAALVESAQAGDDEAIIVHDEHAARTPFTARLGAETRVRVGDEVRVSVDPGLFHFFDHETGRALAWPREAEADVRQVAATGGRRDR